MNRRYPAKRPILQILAVCTWLSACGDSDLALLALADRAERHFEGGRFPEFREDEKLVDTVSLGGESLPALTPPFPSRITFSVDVPQMAFLDFAVAVVTPRPARRARVEFSVTLDVDDRQVLLYREAVRSPRANRWLRQKVDVSAWGGRRVELVFETQPALGQREVPWAGRLLATWGDPTLTSRAPEHRRRKWSMRVRKLLPGRGGPNDAPSFVFLLVDALRPDYLGAYGFEGEISPALDRLAMESSVFDNGYTPAPWTKPAIATLFTSLYPEVHGVFDHESKFRGRSYASTGILPLEAVTLAEVLRKNGYATAAFVANPWLDVEYGYAQGFETYEVHDQSASLLEAALEFIGRESEPFFVYLHFMDVHGPYQPPRPDFEALLASPSLGDPHTFSQEEYNLIPDYLTHTAWANDEERYRLRHWRAKYGGAVRAFDRRIGPFLDTLRNSGVLDNAFVVLTSDHGEELFERRSWGHGFDLWEHQIHVPLFIRQPVASHAGRRLDELVNLIDLMPTLLSLAGIESPPDLQGRDLSKLLEDGQDESTDAVFASATKAKLSLYAVRTRRYKLIADVKEGHRNVYDLETDPGELEDISYQRPEVSEELYARLLQHLAELSSRGTWSRREAPIPDELLERLRSLGYVR